MKKIPFSIILAIIIVAPLLMFMFTFQVRYDEVAVATRFERAVEPQRNADGTLSRDAVTGELVDGGWLYEEAGIYPRLPWPINNVYKYSKRLQTLESEQRQVQLADNQTVIVQIFTVWRIDDPYAFFSTLRSEDIAEDRLRSIVQGQAISGVISQFAFSDFVNAEAGAVRLGDIEETMSSAVQEQLVLGTSSYGIKIESVGIRQLVLPEETTEPVFDRMRSTQERLAEDARARGEARAATIRSEAETDRDRILAFADRRARAIRTEGDQEASALYDVFAENEELAIFLRRVESLREMLPNNTTFILSAEDIGLRDLVEPLTQPGPVRD
ncbi:MAG: SPFH domain-containing protein [Myxococcota bacterium]